ncbi:MAG: shikimate dehydrogenase [Phycisphaerae bacterium]
MTERRRTRLIVPVCSPNPEQMLADARRAVTAGADAVELRLDALPALPSHQLLRDLLAACLPAESIVTCRPEREGGAYDGDETRRLETLKNALQCGATWVDVELDTDPAVRPDPSRTILSHHDFDRCPPDLDTLASTLDAAEAGVGKVAFAADGPSDALRALDVLRNAGKPTLALAMGEAGVLSRIAARKLGAFGTFAALESGAESAPGQPTIHDLRSLYRWDEVTPQTPLMGVVGCPVAHSMSPAIHNAALSATGTDGFYVPLLIQPGWENFARFLDGIRRRPWLNWRGLSVTIPHKENALRYVGEADCDGLAVRIGAVNTITFQPDGALRGDNTDYAAAIDALCDAMGISRPQLDGRGVTVLGAGGAARAIVAALCHYGAAVTVCNRTVKRASKLAEEFGASAQPLEAAERTPAEVVVNCTPIGMHPDVDACPVRSLPPGTQVVFDTIYNPVHTRLLQLAERAGAVTLTGVDMFVRQGAAQFSRWTGKPAPAEVMRSVILRTPGH